ncbi:hypothetical protein WBG78_28735 [Chryseolinea sp. T2]|uniref:hypothetical protein n=1 Tax=Chryseolinea sp. T2 TaxID=3129255 RepID=UPI003076FEF0
MFLLSSEFYGLIFYGFIAAAPLACYGIDWYLQQYAYKAAVSFFIYPIALMVALMLDSFTTAYQMLCLLSVYTENIISVTTDM